MRGIIAYAIVWMLFVSLPSPAADGPVAEVRIVSLNELLPIAEYLGGIVDQAENAKQGAGLIRSMIDEKKGLEGIDPSRPIGAYASLTPDVINSPIVVLIPLANEQSFLDLLTLKAGLEPKPLKDGLYEVAVPNVPAPVYFRFANKYIYMTIRNASSIDEHKLMDPKVFFAAKQMTTLSMNIRLDRIPEELRNTVLSQFEFKMSDAKLAEKPMESRGQKNLRHWGINQITDLVHLVGIDGEAVEMAVNVLPEKEDIGVELKLTGKSKTQLAESVGKFIEVPSVANRFVANRSAIGNLGVCFAMNEASRKDLSSIIDDLLAETVANAKEAERPFIKSLLNVIAPTLKAGKLDIAAQLNRGAAGKPTLTVALGIREGLEVEKLAKALAIFVPKEKVDATFNIAKVQDGNLHRVIVSSKEMEDVFGTNRMWIIINDDVLIVSVEQEGTMIREVAKNKPSNNALFASDLAVEGFAPLVDRSRTPEEWLTFSKEVFGEKGPAKRDRASLSIKGGKDLSLRIHVKGAVVQFLATLNR